MLTVQFVSNEITSIYTVHGTNEIFIKQPRPHKSQHQRLIQELPLFTNWVELLVLHGGSKGGFEDCDRIVTLCSISHVLVLQKPSDEPPSFFTTFPWILSPFDSSSTSTTKDLPLLRYPKQFMLYTEKPS